LSSGWEKPLHSNESAGSGTQSTETVVVGGGIIGIATALALANRGCSVVVLDPGHRAGVSSWSGGGILSPLYPWRHAPGANVLARYSQNLYGELARRMRDVTGVDPELRSQGMLYVDFPSRPPVDRTTAREWCREAGYTFEELEGEEVTQREPELSPVAEGGFRLPAVQWIRNPRLMRGLRRLAEEAGVELRDGASVVRLHAEAGEVQGVETDRGFLAADRVVVAAGPWSGDLLGRIGVRLPVRPIKGAMLLLQAPRRLLSEVVMAGSYYLIPRADNRILVGSTTEEDGFDARTTLGSVRSLGQAAVDILPATANLELEDYWSGLRPESPDGAPFIGPVPGIEGLYVNAGHYRNGVVQAPGSGELLAALMTGEEAPLDPEPFALHPGERT
jgi:glycine oxidase